MKIALVGASGRAGSHILKELSDRSHTVTAIARDAARIATLPGVTPVAADAADPRALAAFLEGHEVVVSAVKFTHVGPVQLIPAVKAAGVSRYLVVGGAGSLLDANGVKLVDGATFPDAYKPEARAGAAFLDQLRGETELDWTFLSPAFIFANGERTGRFRLAGDTALTVPDGPTRISFADYAIALVDEIETPGHRRQRFSVAY